MGLINEGFCKEVVFQGRSLRDDLFFQVCAYVPPFSVFLLFVFVSLFLQAFMYTYIRFLY